MSPDEIKQLRKILNLTQEEFARLIGSTLGSVCRWENGRKPSKMALNKLRQIQTDYNKKHPKEKTE